jgi:hypothetical protein
MSLVVTCSCGQSFRAQPQLAGKRVQCPACGSPLQIPLLPPAPSADPLGLGGLNEWEMGTPLPRAPVSRPLPTQRSYGPARKKRRIRINSRVWVVAGGVLAGVVACVLVLWGAWFAVGLIRSPQAVFETAKSAAEREDWETFCGCLTPESRDQMAGMLVVVAAMMRGFGGLAALGGPEKAQAAQAKIKPIVDVLDKHGLDEATLKSMRPTPMQVGQTPPDQLQRVLAPIKDRSQFIADMINAMKQFGAPQDSKPLQSDARLENVVIDGDAATGTVVQTRNGVERRDEMRFKRIGVSWKIDLGTPGVRSGTTLGASPFNPPS